MQNVNKSEATSMLTTRFRSSSPSSSQTGTGRFRSEAAATLNSSVNLFSSFFYHLIVHSCLFFRLQDIIYGAFKSRQLSRAVASDKPGHNDGTVTGSPRDQSLHVRLAQRHLLHAALPAPGPGQDPPPDVADWHAAGVEQAWHDDGVSPRGEDRAAAGTLERSVAGLPISHVTAAALPLSQSFVRTIPGVGLYFSTYYTLTQHFIPEGSPGALEAVLLGGGARTVAGVFMLPVTVIKTRFECGRYSYGSVTGALRSVCSSEGPAALFSGLMPTLLRDVPFSGIYVMFYSQTKTSLPQEIRESHYAPLANFACGVLAGVLASLVTQPADVVKTQVQVNPQLRTSEAVRIIYTEHGLQGFLRGAVPRSLRRTLMAAMAWTVYEQMMARIGLKS